MPKKIVKSNRASGVYTPSRPRATTRRTTRKSTSVKLARRTPTTVRPTRRVARRRGNRQPILAGYQSLIWSFFKSFLGASAVGLAVLAMATHWLVPHLLFNSDNPEVVLLVPKQAQKDGAPARLLLAYFGPDKKREIIQLSGESRVSPDQFGDYDLAEVYPELQEHGQSKQAITAIYSQIFHLPITRVEAIDSATDSKQWSESLLAQLKKSPLDLSWWRLVYLWQTTPKHERENLPKWLDDHNQKPIAKTNNWVFFDQQLTPTCPIAVSNGAGISGLAGRISNLIEGISGLVIRVATGYEPQPVTQLIVSATEPNCEAVARVMTQFFPSSEIKLDSQGLPEEYRAKILVLLGQDMEIFEPSVEAE